MTATKRQKRMNAVVRLWMKDDVFNHVDETTNEVNCTELAECAADCLNLYDNDQDFTIPEWVYDIAAQVGEEYEKRQM